MSTLDIEMNDPLAQFNWDTIHGEYDRLCKRFDPGARYLNGLSRKPATERDLYYQLVEAFVSELRSSGGLTIQTYEAMLYWKLYSQPAAIANTCRTLSENKSIRETVTRGLKMLSIELRDTFLAASDVPDQVKKFGKHTLWGMKTSTALPVRTTFLHFVSPSTVPIFDKQVLLAVGVAEKGANQRMEVLRAYLPHAQALASKYSKHFSTFRNETPIRLVDMALWVIRGGCG